MFSLGQNVWWVEEDRPIGKDARVWVCEAKFLTGRHTGNCVAVIIPGKPPVTTLLENRPLLFDSAADATTFAFGCAHRLIANFHYHTVEVKDHSGRIHLIPANVVKPNVEAAPV